MTALLMVLVAFSLAGLSVLFTRYEHRLAVADAAPPQPAEASDPPATEVLPAPGEPIETVTPPLFVSARARCHCADAFEEHAHGRCTRCSCRRFLYAGGLVAQAN